MERDIWSGFYKKALGERLDQLRMCFPDLFPDKPDTAPRTPERRPASADSTGPPLLSFTEKPHAEADEAPLALSPTSSASSGDSATMCDAAQWPVRPLTTALADTMIENCIGVLGVPVGLALNLVVNGEPAVVPMAIEEPSVVAAVSGAAKTIAALGGGFSATASARNTATAQIQLLDVPAGEPLYAATRRLHAHRDDILAAANSLIGTMVARGGGAIGLVVRHVTKRKSPGEKWLVVHLQIDVCEAMGANCAATVAEGVGPLLAEIAGARLGVRIVSNLNLERTASASFRIPVAGLGYKGVDGATVARRIVDAGEWAADDPFRCATHNKGIMNGVDAVALATGQDWRAIEAGAHSFAAVEHLTDAVDASGAFLASEKPAEKQLRPLTRFTMEKNADGTDVLCGEIMLPMSVGTRGGVLRTNPAYAFLLGLMGNPDARRLCMVMAAVGLAQNFAALRALTTEGIQRGHMGLHAGNLAAAAGAPPHAIGECVRHMVATRRLTLQAAHDYLEAHSLLKAGDRAASNPTLEAAGPQRQPPSLLFFAETPHVLAGAGDRDALTLNIAFVTSPGLPAPATLRLTPDDSGETDPLVTALFGAKRHSWLMETLQQLEAVQLHAAQPPRANALLVLRLKLISVLLHLVALRLGRAFPRETSRLVELILARESESSSQGLARARSRSGAGVRASSPVRRPPSLEPLRVSEREKGPLKSMPPSPTYRRTHIADQTRRIAAAGAAALQQSVLARTSAAELAGAAALALGDATPCPASAPEDLAASWDNLVRRSGVFQENLLSLSVKLATESPTKADRLLQVGLPLMIALWQVFELRVLQWVGQPRLASQLLAEQRRVMSAAVAATGEGADAAGGEPSRDAFSAYMAVHAKRFLGTLFLLCDTIGFDPTITTRDRLAFVRVLGAHLEWQHARAHDLCASRLEAALDAICRSVPPGGPVAAAAFRGNSFLYWLALMRPNRLLPVHDAISSGANPSWGALVESWRSDVMREYAADTHVSWSLDEAAFCGTPSRLFDAQLVQNASSALWAYYHVSDLFS